MAFDYKCLGDELTIAGLTGKPVNNYTKEEVDLLVMACLHAIRPGHPGYVKPFVEELRDALVGNVDADTFIKFFGSEEVPF